MLEIIVGRNNSRITAWSAARDKMLPQPTEGRRQAPGGGAYILATPLPLTPPQ